jgi:hypothetical protein
MIPGHGRSGPPQSSAIRPDARRIRSVASCRFVRGQVFALLLPMLAVLVAALWWVLETGESVVEKQRLRNTADAAVLAAAAWQARALNFDATMNRAIVANEALIAQSVSLRGWSEYMDQMLTRSSLVTAAVPYLGEVMLYLQRGWHVLDRVLQPALLTAEAATSVVNHDLALAQRGMHESVPVMVNAIVHDVVARNDPRYEVTVGGDLLLAGGAASWSGFSSFYGGAWRWRQRDVVQRSLDGFTHERNWSLGVLPGAPLGRLEKRGGTDLIDFDTWRAIETFAMHQRRYLIVGRMREAVPIAWAGVENGERSMARGIHGGAFRTNPRTARLAERQTRKGVGYLGLPSMWDLSATQRSEFSPPLVAVRVALREDRRRGAAATLGFGAMEDLEGANHPLGSASRLPMMVEAAATTSFARPVPRADGAQEAPSLYSPYWRPRLANLPTAMRLGVAALDGDPMWLAGVPR